VIGWSGPRATDGGAARLTPVDLSRLADHAFLSGSDRCSFLLEFNSGRDPRHGDILRILRDFKCAPSAAMASAPLARRKRRAIGIMAGMLRAAVSRHAAQQVTWVPVPPSKARPDPDFDDRLMQTLQIAFRDYDVDVRPLLIQARSTPADHLGRTRLGADALMDNLCLDLTILGQAPVRQAIQLFDDVLTSGKHYKCCERRLRDSLPLTPIFGVFLLRRAVRHRWGAIF
jgi:hypothetical protein